MVSTTHLTASEDALFQDLGEWGVLVNLAEGRYVKLNSTAAAIWNALGGNPTLSDLTRDVAKTYGVGPDQIADDVHDAVLRLAEMRLLRAVE